MQLTCIRPFGNFRVGDVVEVADGAVFDGFFFTAAIVPPAEAEGSS